MSILSWLFGRKKPPFDSREQYRSDVRTLVGHHWNEIGTITRAAAAAGYGLDPEKYATPYTQKVQNIRIGSPLLAALLGAALPIAGAAGMWWLLTRDVEKPAAERVVVDETKQYDVQFEYHPPEEPQ